MSQSEYQQQGFYTMHFQIDGPHRVGSTSGGAGGLLPPQMYNPIERVMRSGLFGPWDVSEIVTDELPPGLNPGNKKNWGLDSFQIFPNFAIVFWETGWYLTYHYWPTAHNRLLFEANAYFTPPRNVRDRLAQQLGIATIKEYKGHRKDAPRPLYYEEARQYLEKYHGAKVYSSIEADDALAMMQTDDTVIVSIDKRYPGHARKIMSAFWGLGQLMFSKCIVVVDKDVNVQDEAEVAWITGTHVDPSRDIQIVTGPVDDLDDAAVMPAFGGKMGVDATRKGPSRTTSIGLSPRPAGSASRCRPSMAAPASASSKRPS
jgi:hypothetical protein